MSEAVDAIQRLQVLANEIDSRGTELAQVERELEPVQTAYDDFVMDHEIGLWTRSQDEEGFKLPAEALRVKLAQRAMPPELLGKHRGLQARRDRLKTRIGNLKVQVDAQRSILSALKEGVI